MSLDVKQTALRILSRHPVYRALPPGALRACGALLYHGERSSPEQVAQLAGSMRTIPTRYLAPAMVAARAAFRAGRDELVEPTLDQLEQRYPEAVGPRVLRADLLAYHGRYDAALRSAQAARMLQPAAASATARTVRFAYQALEPAQADDIAATAVRRFPRNSEVLWAVCKGCHTVAQYQRLHSAWEAGAHGKADLRHAVRPLASAASRAGEVATAIALYREAMLLVVRDGPAGGRITEAQLAGRGAWGAMQDLRDAMDRAGVPFFFAAGTALGLVREGRPLSADSDIDIGVFEPDWDRDALIALFTRDPRFELDLHPQTKRVTIRHRGGSPIDVFRFYREGDHIYHDGVFVRWRNSPFEVRRQEINGLSAPLPADPDTYLAENYGAEWRTPNPAFDAFTDDAPNVEVTWPEYEGLHFVRRAYKRLVAGDRAGARQELRRGRLDDLAKQIGDDH
jgi:tetratricopeptide (TPR) repeat protein